MHRRLQGLSLGLALLALLGVGMAAGRGAFAQDATPTPSTTSEESTPSPSTSSDTTEAAEEAERNAFIDAFAAQFGVTDEAEIDAAIQAALVQIVDDRVAAGELTEAEGAVLKERIAAGEFRFGVRVGGPGGGHDHGDSRRGHSGRDDRGDGSDKPADEDDSTVPGAEATPSTSTGVTA
jgi:hypothetical protein